MLALRTFVAVVVGSEQVHPMRVTALRSCSRGNSREYPNFCV
jgi:hypothetical protein